MLLQFNFKNFKSFRDETTLDMTAANVTEFSEHVVLSGGEKVLPITAIYGPNASGKSNVCGAFEYMREMVLYSFRNSGIGSNIIRPEWFFFGGLRYGRLSSFEVFFTCSDDKKDQVFNYGFSINKSKIVEEWLNIKAKTSNQNRRIFYRNESSDERQLDLRGIGKTFRENIKVSLGDNALLLSLGNSLLIPELQIVSRWFSLNSTVSFGSNAQIPGKQFEQWFRKHQNEDKAVLDYLGSFDDSIDGIEILEYEREAYSEDGLWHLTSEIIAFHGSNHGLTLESESDGTLQMLDLYPTLATAFRQGGVIFVDELGAHLHPLLLRNIVLSFLNPEVNKGHAQLIFTTHDVWLLFAGLLRRDEVWFTEKGPDGASSLYSLADFQDEDGKKIRKDESFGKNYLLGKYGAIPQLSQIGCFS